MIDQTRSGKRGPNALRIVPITPNAIPLRDLLTEADPSALPEELIPLLSWRQRLALFGGREKKGGKTTYAATAAARYTSGGTHLGRRLTPGRVLWTMAEGHDQDLARILCANHADPDRFYVHKHLGHDRLAQLEANVADVKPDVVIIDTLAAFTDDRITDASTSTQWLPIFRRFTTIAQEHNCAVTVIAHTRKDNEEIRDSTAITGAVDMKIIVRDHQRPNARRIQALGRWPVPDAVVELTDDGYQLLDATSASSSTTTSSAPKSRDDLERIAAAMLAADPNASNNAIRKTLRVRGVIADEIVRKIKGI